MSRMPAKAIRETAWRRFREDAARWKVQELVADADALTTGEIVGLLYRCPSLRAMAWFRLASAAKQAKVPALPGILQRRLLRVYGLELLPGSDVEGGLYIAHPAGVTIVAERIGKNVTVIAAVTVGYREGRRWPRLGDGAYIGAGARVLGDIDIGAGARVGANAVVLTDVPDGATAIGIPAVVRPARTETAEH